MRVREARRRKRLPCLRPRTMQSPGSSGEIDGAGLSRRPGARTRDESAAAIHLQFAEDVAVRRRWPRHQHAHITAARRYSKMKIVILSCVSGQRYQRAPRCRIVRNLHLALGCAGDPVQLDAVECEAATKIDVHPLLVEAGAHPCAGEAVRATNLYALGSVIELDLPKFGGDVRQPFGVGVAELDALVTAAVWAVERDRRPEDERAVGHVGRIIFCRKCLRPVGCTGLSPGM